MGLMAGVGWELGLKTKGAFVILFSDLVVLNNRFGSRFFKFSQVDVNDCPILGTGERF
jgi:hypothetical protein